MTHSTFLRLPALRGPALRVPVHSRMPLRLPAVLLLGAAFAALLLTASGAPMGLPVHAQVPFQVGAAVADFTPYCGVDVTTAAQRAAVNCTAPPNGFLDPAACVGTGFTGQRLFAFEEPYTDSNGNGHYDAGEPFVDCNLDGRWDGNLIGGGSNTPRFYNHVADPVTARAVVVGNGTKTIAIEVLDHEGAFNVYIENIRNAVGTRCADAGLNKNDIFISSTHDESAPDSLGLYGVNSATSSSNPYWVKFFVQKSAQAIVDACTNSQPAVITYGEGIQPANLRQCFSSYPFVDNQLMPTFQAVNNLTGKMIVTLTNIGQHTETLGFNGGSTPDPGAPTPTTLSQEKTWLSADWPYWYRHELETYYDGGVAIEMAGSVGSNETPQVFSGALNRTPEKFQDGGHPAGCRTTWNPNGTMTPLGYYSEDVALGHAFALATEAALAAGAPTGSTEIQGARADTCVHISNGIFTAGGVLGIFAERPTYDDTCTVAFPPQANGSVVGTAVKTQVAAFRIGDGEFVSIPGEVFPFTYLRSFLGPQDMPCPNPNPGGSCNGPPNPTSGCSGDPMPLPPWLMPHMHTPYRFIDGEGEDMIGYIFPCGNGVGVPGEYLNDPSGTGPERFGCGHSDDSESASSHAADVLGNAAVPLLDNLGGAPAAVEDIRVGRYLMPDNTASRNPLGTPPSIQCNVNQVFTPMGPANRVKLQDGTVITPSRWMSLSGRPQATPDRNTRGWIDANGTRHWLDVFPDIQPADNVPEVPSPLLLLLVAALLGCGWALRRRAESAPRAG